ncbi:MAG: carbohydrate kinase [Flavobacteriaceae bacterium]|jgi:fructokinase|nr:carbohydrate kinase [Flavobacteriales bacterium]MDG1831144.1 carbohydrate kinase [Flavobacteriaceae bacterium]
MSKRIVCFGETLWDVLPSGSVPGGAPMNVAIRTQSLGLDATIISRIGVDKLGIELRQYLKKKQVNTSLLQTDKKFPTGKVDVSLDEKGVAEYDIKYPVAWDKIELSKASIEKVKKADAFIFGSLVCRDSISRETLLSLLEYAKFKVFDVNLRSGFFDASLIEKLMKSSDLIKLNDDELSILSNRFGSKSDDLYENIKFIHKKLQLKSICVTRAEKGAILFIDNVFYSNNGIIVDVVDSVGAGDSFLSALIYKLLSQNDHQNTLNFACAVGTLVATKTGANSKISANEIRTIIKQFN